MGKIRRMFLGSNSSVGFYSLFPQIQSMDLKQFFIIKGGPGTGKSVFIKKIGKHVENMGYDLEYYHCSSDCNSLDGIFVPELKIALVDGTAPHIVDPKYPGIIDEILDFARFLDKNKLLPYKKNIIQASEETSLYFKIAYLHLKQASILLEQHRLIYERKTDNRKVIMEIEGEIFRNIQIDKKTPTLRKFFASGITPQGICSYYKTLVTKDMNIYCLNEYMWLNTQKILSKIANTAYELGLDTEVYHCPLMPDTIDMVIIPQLNTAIINTSYPYHSNNIEKNIYQNIKDIDIYPHNSQIKTEHFNSFIDMAIENIKKAKAAHDILEDIYVEAMDFEEIDNLYSLVLESLLII